ncbi:MAG TPA: rhomboid family intramembrane serine protease [Bryobacteraceae bacterium]|nr:rhomboid family intramembrane serine protease [Bryobacteraceae bacterium]
MEKRRMCPNCRAFVDRSDHVCPYCDAKLGPRAIDRRSPAPIAGIIPGTQFTAAMILLINIGLYIVTAVFSMKLRDGRMAFDIPGQILAAFGAKYTPAIAAGEWWRLITAGFLHGGLLHILMNSWALYGLAGQVEELYGSARFIVFYIISTIFGFLASTFWSGALSVGASAGIFGLIGVMIAFGIQHDTSLGSAVRAHYTQWAIYGLVMGLMPGFRVDNAAHLGGLAAGFAIGWLAGPPKLYESWRDTFWKAAAGVCLAVTAFSFLMMTLQLLAVTR